MSFPKNIIYNKTYEIEKFDLKRFEHSLLKYGQFDENVLLNGLNELSKYHTLHYSRLIELGVQSFKNEEDAKRYYERYWKDSGIFNRLRRITGYISSDLSTWNDAKKAEEKDRIKHISSKRKLTSQEEKTIKEIEKSEQENLYGKS